MTSVLIVSVVLAVSGLLAYRAVQHVEQATAVVATLDPAPWREVSGHIHQVTDELSLRIGDRTDR